MELTEYRERFPILRDTTYLINHSLGAMPAATEERLLEFARMWKERGIRAWGEGWWEMPMTVGDQIAEVLERHTPLRGASAHTRAVELLDSGEFIGFVGLSVPRRALPFSPCVEVGWRLAFSYWGKGFATEGAGAALRVGDPLDKNTDVGAINSKQQLDKIGRPSVGDLDHVEAQLFGGSLRLVYRHYPINLSHSHAQLAAEAAEAAGAHGRFWEMHAKLFINQDALDRQSLERYAIEIGLDVPRFYMELATGAHRERILSDIESGEESGVHWTPTFFINGVRFGYAPSLDGLLEALRTAAAEATGHGRHGVTLPRGVPR